MSAAQPELAPIVKTQMAKRITRSGLTRSAECWAAQTTDGLWDFEREDSPGTPWLAYHWPSLADGSYPLPVTMLSTLRQCRIQAASGTLDRELARLQAHEGGEHEAQREPRCRKC